MRRYKSLYRNLSILSHFGAPKHWYESDMDGNELEQLSVPTIFRDSAIAEPGLQHRKITTPRNLQIFTSNRMTSSFFVLV
jgi:hypothetical protein